MIGTRLAHYEITSHLGTGGMGEVYQATDSKLGRSVAIKLLPEAFMHDADRAARFEREARVLASLNHPNIAAIHGLEESGGRKFLVMELVPGETLAERVRRGPIPVDEALEIAKQIAEALEAAHESEKTIIHRDLKPANVKVTPDGKVKVLDFGLAKAYEAQSASPSLSNSPTLSMAATMPGVILGTAAYMSPEQAKGRPVDRRTDIFAFGAVLYEMLAGRPAFDGDDVGGILARVIEREPDWSKLPPKLPPRIQELLRRCLEKDVHKRRRDAGELRIDIEQSLAEPLAATAVTTSTRGSRMGWIAFAAAVLVVSALAIPAMRYLRETPPPETRTELVTPATDQPTSFALSPDGGQIVFVASGDGSSRLWLRSLATTAAQPLAGTEGATLPFWAPDSRAIGFFAAGALKRLDLGGGAPQTLAPANSGRGGTWNADGVILFAPSQTTPLMRVSATGGMATAVTTLGPQQASHRSPHLLPDGRRFLFYAQGAPDTSGIYLGALDGSAPTRLTAADSAGVFLPSGWLLWVRAGTLVAQRLDLAQVALTGEPLTLADGVVVDGFLRSAVSVAATGLVAYRTGAGSQRQLAWFDRSGTARGTVGDPDSSFLNPRVSPNGRRVAVSRTLQGNQDIWLLDGARTSRVTFDAASEVYPLWSPDGTRIVFRSQRTGPGDLYQRLASGAGAEEQFVASDLLKSPTSWSADGRFLLYNSTDPQTNTDLWVVPMSGANASPTGRSSQEVSGANSSAVARSQKEMAGNRTPSVLLKTPFREAYGTFSPDGRWVAYMSRESGRMEIYVRPFVPPGTASATVGAAEGQWQVSTAGGVFPAWRPDGKEMYYLNPEGALMAAPIVVTGATLEPGAPVALFPTRIYGGGVDEQQGRQYDVAPDGRFLINTVLDEAAAPITLIQNWNPDIKER